MARVKEIRGGEKGREATKHSRYFVIKKVAKKNISLFHFLFFWKENFER